MGRKSFQRSSAYPCHEALQLYLRRITYDKQHLKGLRTFGFVLCFTRPHTKGSHTTIHVLAKERCTRYPIVLGRVKLFLFNHIKSWRNKSGLFLEQDFGQFKSWSSEHPSYPTPIDFGAIAPKYFPRSS